MPIKSPQFASSFPEMGRIRTGITNGNRPDKLKEFRFTSPNRDVIEAVAERYGGEVRQWKNPKANPPVQWEVLSTSSVLDITIPSAAMFEQWLEKWDAGGCVVRTDGEWEFITGTPWTVGDSKEALEAEGVKPVTRLSVLLDGVPGFGTWRLEIHSYYGTRELGGVQDIMRAAGLQFEKAQLVLETRTTKKSATKTGGKPLTMNYVVPKIVLARELGEVMQLAQARAFAGELTTGEETVQPMRSLHQAPAPLDHDNPADLDRDADPNAMRQRVEATVVVKTKSATKAAAPAADDAAEASTAVMNKLRKVMADAGRPGEPAERTLTMAAARALALEVEVTL